MIVAFVDELRADGFAVESICRVLREQGCQVAARTYRSWREPSRPVCDRTMSDALVIDAVRDIAWTVDPEGRRRLTPEGLYGRRKMTAWLARNGFPEVSKHTVDRLMRQEGMNGLVRGRRTRTTIPAKTGGVRAGDLLNRIFTAPRPNHAWVTDFTYVRTWCGFVYVAFVIDLFSRAIVGWSASTTKDVAFVEQCLQMALWRRDHTDRPVLAGMIHHSDAGSQGGFNWSSQHLVSMEVFDGASTTCSGSCGAASDEVAWSSVSGQVCRAGVLAKDRRRYGERGRRRRCRRVRAGGVAMVPPRWRDAADQPCRVLGPVPVVR
jgi:transposase InsO family protein